MQRSSWTGSHTGSGATTDLIREGATGFSIDFSETEKVGDLTEWILHHPTEAGRIGRNAARFIREHDDIPHSVDGMLNSNGGPS